MGDFKGHVYPGACIMFMAIRWLYCIFYRHYLCLREEKVLGSSGRKFRSSLTFPTRCAPRYPIEAIVWLILNLIIIIGEIISWTIHHKTLIHLDHLTITNFFLIPAIVVLLKHCKYRMLPGLEYGCLIMTLMVLGYVLFNHKHDKDALEVQLHLQSLFTFIVVIVAVAIEMKNRHSPLAALFRAFSAVVAGSMLIVTGFIMYPQFGGTPWPSDDHSLSIAGLTLPWQYGLTVVLTTITGLTAHYNVKRLSSTQIKEAMEVEVSGWRRHCKALSVSCNGRTGAMNGGVTATVNEDTARLLLHTDEDEV